MGLGVNHPQPASERVIGKACDFKDTGEPLPQGNRILHQRSILAAIHGGIKVAQEQVGVYLRTAVNEITVSVLLIIGYALQAGVSITGRFPEP